MKSIKPYKGLRPYIFLSHCRKECLLDLDKLPPFLKISQMRMNNPLRFSHNLI